jgi:hypothetical protein
MGCRQDDNQIEPLGLIEGGFDALVVDAADPSRGSVASSCRSSRGRLAGAVLPLSISLRRMR